MDVGYILLVESFMNLHKNQEIFEQLILFSQRIETLNQVLLRRMAL